MIETCRSVLSDFSKEQSMLPEDDRMIETCRGVLSDFSKEQCKLPGDDL